jgi:ABC-type Zn2+ transport system substrate-binding protein/surface adhesin
VQRAYQNLMGIDCNNMHHDDDDDDDNNNNNNNNNNDDHNNNNNNSQILWFKTVPFKIYLFPWRMFLTCILTKDNLVQRRPPLVGS